MELKDFLAALASDWVSLMTGIASVVLLILGAFRDWNRVPRPLIWTAAALCFFFAAARVWTTEHRARIKAEQQLSDITKPDFVFGISQMISRYQKEGNVTVALISAEILNKGAASVTGNWKAHYKSPTLDGDMDFVTPDREPVMFGGSGPAGAVAFYGTKAIQLTTSVNRIERGDRVSGRMLLTIPGNRSDEISSGQATVTISMEDYLGRSYSAEFIGGPGTERLKFLPGELPHDAPKKP